MTASNSLDWLYQKVTDIFLGSVATILDFSMSMHPELSACINAFLRGILDLFWTGNPLTQSNRLGPRIFTFGLSRRAYHAKNPQTFSDIQLNTKYYDLVQN